MIHEKCLGFAFVEICANVLKHRPIKKCQKRNICQVQKQKTKKFGADFEFGA